MGKSKKKEKNKKPEIHKFLHLSTLHVTREVIDMLETHSNEETFCQTPLDADFFVWKRPIPFLEGMPGYFVQWQKGTVDCDNENSNVPKSLRDAIRFAEENKASGIILDQVIDHLDKALPLPIYDHDYFGE